MKSNISSSRFVLRELRAPEVSGELFRSIASWVLDRPTSDVSLVGTQAQVDLIGEAMAVTKEFHVALNSPTVTLDEVSDKLQKKHDVASRFESAFGTQWPL